MLKILTFLRVQRGLTQQDVASVLGVSSRTVLRWEGPGGNPTLDDLKKIAALFDVSISYLVGDETELHYWWHKNNLNRFMPDGESRN